MICLTAGRSFKYPFYRGVSRLQRSCVRSAAAIHSVVPDGSPNLSIERRIFYHWTNSIHP